jgi:N-acyl-phosphatidylethanolamine-hydrolysing phospholipase D
LALGNSVRWYVPAGLKQWFVKRGITNVVEMTWWQTEKFSNDVTIVATPCEHWSKRHLFKKNDSLWNSYVVLGKRSRLFFAGDTAYCNVFSLIGRKYGPFDLAFIPIGSYHPREQQR